MGWRPWRDLRERSNVEYAAIDMPPGWGRGICLQWPDRAVILVDRALDPVERLTVLAHELVHLERGGSGWQPDLPESMRPVVTREERRVDRIVAERLLPLGELAAFVDARCEVEPITAEVVAEEFGVTATVARTALGRLKEAA